MPRYLRPLLALASLLVLLAPGRAERIHLVVLHTNDVHGQVLPRPATWLEDQDPPPLAGGLARLGAHVARVRAEVEAAGGHVLVVDGGDWFQGTPEGGLEGGRPFLEALALVGYDALCVGNHELDLGLTHFRELLAGLELPAVLANASERGEPLPGCAPYRIATVGPLRVALVGLLTPRTREMTPPEVRELELEHPARTLGRLRAELSGQADWILPLTHLGVDEDRALARDHPWLDLVVGGHSHTYLRQGVREGETLIVQAGSKASGVGRVDVWLDGETLEVLELRARVDDLLQACVPADAEPLTRACDELIARTSGVMDEVVGELAAPLTRSRDHLASSPAGNLVTDVMRRRGRADVALQNRSGLRADIDAGPVTRRELYDLLPFGNTLVTLDLSGAELLVLLRRSVEGMARSGLEISGVQLVVRTGGEAPVLARVLVGGAELDPRRSYRVATSSFLAEGGDAYLELTRAERKVHHAGALRDHLERHLARRRCVRPPAEDRYGRE